MIDWLGIGHLFELSLAEAIAGFLTPLAIFAVFFLAQFILPARRVTGYVINPETDEPRNYRLSGILVFAIALIVWGFELTGMPRDWFYRSTMYAVAGGTVLCAIFSLWAVFSRPQGRIKNPFFALWEGRSLELPFFNERFDVKMYLYVVGGTMLLLNAMSRAAYHYELFGGDSNPGVFLYAAFLTFYVFDYFVFERVQLYTYDLIHEHLGLKLTGAASWSTGGFISCHCGVWPHTRTLASRRHGRMSGPSERLRCSWLGGAYRAAQICRNTPSSAGPTASFSESSSLSTFKPVTARSCAVAFGVLPDTPTTSARGSFRSQSGWSSAISPIPGLGPSLYSS